VISLLRDSFGEETRGLRARVGESCLEGEVALRALVVRRGDLRALRGENCRDGGIALRELLARFGESWRDGDA